MPTTVPTPALDSASYMSFGPEVPPVILQRTLPHLDSLVPTITAGLALDLAASRYSGSAIRTSTMSPRVRGSLDSMSLVR